MGFIVSFSNRICDWFLAFHLFLLKYIVWFIFGSAFSLPHFWNHLFSINYHLSLFCNYKKQQYILDVIQVSSDAKLPVLYLIDSILKNVGDKGGCAYIKLFSHSIIPIFTCVFEKVSATQCPTRWHYILVFIFAKKLPLFCIPFRRWMKRLGNECFRCGTRGTKSFSQRNCTN